MSEIYDIDDMSITDPDTVKYTYNFGVHDRRVTLIHFHVSTRDCPGAGYSERSVWSTGMDRCTAPKPLVPIRVFLKLLDEET